MTTQTEMFEQTEAFPKTKLDLAEEFLEHFQSDVESAEKSLLNARVKLGAAQILRDDAEENLRRERIAEGIASPEEIALDMKRIAEADGMGPSFQVNGEEPIVIAEPPACDPITGEVDTRNVGKKCPDCQGDGRLPDKTGGGHHRCKKCEGTGSLQLPHSEPYVSVVIALYPGDDEPHVTKIGEKTRYGELVADYFTAAGLNGKHDAKDWAVVAEDELTTTGGARELRDVISGADYGKRLLVVAADQGSVTGVAKAEESTA